MNAMSWIVLRIIIPRYSLFSLSREQRVSLIFNDARWTLVLARQFASGISLSDAYSARFHT